MTNVAGVPEEPRRFAWTKLAWVVVFLVLVWAWYTTFAGMERILGNPIGPAIMATATQTMLAIVSYLLGKDLAHYLSGQGGGGQRSSVGAAIGRYTLLIGLFILSLTGSAFFSFNFYFNELFKYRQSNIVYAELPQQLNTAVMPDLADAVRDAYRIDAERLVASPTTKNWLESLDNIASQAKGARQQIAAAVQKQEEERRKADEIRRQKLGELLKKADEAANMKRRDEDEVRRRQQRLVALEATIKVKAEEKKKADEEMAKARAEAEDEVRIFEERPDGTKLNKFGRKVGEGPFFRATKERENRAKVAVEAAEKSIRGLEEERVKLNAELRDIAAKIAGYDQVMAEAQEAQKATQRTPTAETPANPAGAVDTLIVELGDQRKAFVTDPTTVTYTRLAESCERLLRPLRETPAVASQFGDAACRSDDIARLVEARPQVLTAQKTFDEQCSPGKLSTPIQNAARMAGEGKGKEGLEAAQRVIEGCIGLATETRIRVDVFQKRVSEFIELRSPQRDEFAKTVGAFQLGPTQAWIAAFASCIQDLVIFFFTLLSELLRLDRRGSVPGFTGAALAPVDIGARPDDPGVVASAKAILRLIAHTKGLGDRLDPNGPAWNSLAPELKDNILVQLKSLGRHGRATLDRRGAWTLDRGAVLELEQLVRDQAPAIPIAAPRKPEPETRPDEAKPQEPRTEAPAPAARPAQAPAGNVVPIQQPPRSSRVQELLERESGRNVFQNMRNRAGRDPDER